MRPVACLAVVSAVTLVVTLGMPASTRAAEITEGCLEARDKEGEGLGFCPLEHTDVRVDISGFIARVTLTQQFGNPFDEPIEAVYTFPMSDRAAVDAMTMKIGDRTIKGVIKRREEAQRIYQQARDAGKAASLLDQERPNIFTQSVANILPGDEIAITISYVEYLKYEDGEYEFSFPMVVGPRYIPGAPPSRPEPMRRATPTDQVPDADRITPPVTPEGTRAGHDISLEVRLDAGVPIRDIRSELHEVDIERRDDDAGGSALVRLKNRGSIPNRDFVLKYRVGGEAIEDAVLTHAGAKGGFLTVILQPPKRVMPDMVTPKEMIFVIDCSGSMRGFPIEKAKKTMRLCIEQMNPNDTFNLVSFAGGTGYCFNGPVPNSRANRHKALEYLAGLEGRGGTEMMKAIHAALEGPRDSKRLRIVCFMTDGFIGNDMAILEAIKQNVKTARVFSFGIGNGVNRFLIEQMAVEGRGASAVVTLESDGDAAAERFHERIHSPVLTDITVDFGDLPVRNVYPDVAAIPDLFAAVPLVLKGRYTEAAEGTVTIRGNTAAGPFERTIAVRLPGDAPEHDVLAPLWARARIDWLMARDWLGIQQRNPDPKLKKAITRLGLKYNLVTQFTSFVAVEEKVITEGGKPKTVEVPVEMTDGVSYEGVFGAEGEQLRALGYLGKAKAAPMAAPSLASGRGRTAGVAAGEAVFLAPAGKPTAPPPVTPGQPLRERAEEEKDEAAGPKGHSKLDRALWNLAGKLVNGNYTRGAVKVKDGWVEVVIKLIDDSPEKLRALKAAGVKIVAHTASGKKVFARVRVADLERVVKLEFVRRVEPPA